MCIYIFDFHIFYVQEKKTMNLSSLCDKINDLWSQVGGFLRVSKFPLPMKLTVTK